MTNIYAVYSQFSLKAITPFFACWGKKLSQKGRSAPTSKGITMETKIYYSYFAATGMEDVENMGNIDTLIPTCGTRRTINSHIYWVDRPESIS
jgi:hypothetical protein